MNFLWRFTVLDFKKNFFDKKEAREHNDYVNVLSTSLKSQVDAEKDDEDVFYFSTDDLKFATFLESDYIHDHFSEMEPLWAINQHLLKVEMKFSLFCQIFDLFYYLFFFFF